MFSVWKIAAVALLIVAVACGAGEGQSANAPDSEDVTAQQEFETTEEVIAVGNSLCPVMGGQVVQGQYFDWNGFRIGICCPGCGDAFTADPQQYLPVLVEDPGISEDMRADLSELIQDEAPVDSSGE